MHSTVKIQVRIPLSLRFVSKHYTNIDMENDQIETELANKRFHVMLQYHFVAWFTIDNLWIKVSSLTLELDSFSSVQEHILVQADCIKKALKWPVVVAAQLVEMSFPTPEVRGSNPTIGQLLYRTFICLLSTVWKDKNKENDAEIGPFVKRL